MAGSATAQRVGRLLRSKRIRLLMTQGALADQAATSQQWISRVERGEVDLRLDDVDRLFAAVGAAVFVQLAPWSEAEDPDLIDVAGMGEELAEFVEGYGYLWRRFGDVPFQVGGRVAALAQGLPVQPLWLDLVVPEAALPVATSAMAWLSPVRWSDVNQDYTIYNCDLAEPFPRQFRLPGTLQLRIEVVDELTPAAVQVQVGERLLPVVPLVQLIARDDDIADLARRCGERRPDGG